jgi:hypothetical protein
LLALADSFTWKIEVEHSSEPLVNLYITTWHYIPEVNNLWVPQKAGHRSDYQLSKTVLHGWLLSSHFEMMIFDLFPVLALPYTHLFLSLLLSILHYNSALNKTPNPFYSTGRNLHGYV